MRKALATVTLAGAIVFVPWVTASAALAGPSAAQPAAQTETETDNDEPALQDGNDDTGKYGLIGLTGLVGLFGYKKYRDNRSGRDSIDAEPRR